MNKKFSNSKMQETRRRFLKKAIWTVPVLIGMGQLAKPTTLHAESHIPDPWGMMSSNRNPERNIKDSSLDESLFDESPFDESPFDRRKQ